MRVLLIKLSSLGDVVHTLPAAMDMALQRPDAVIDWVVEPAFAPLLRLCPAVQGVIEMDLRRWRSNPFSAETRAGWRRFKQQLQAQTYDMIIDLQGLTKSAWVSFLARPSPLGVRVAMAHRTEGSSFEAPTRWVADRCISVPQRIHALDRARAVCAQALGYAVPAQFQAGLTRMPSDAASARQVLCVHGTSRDDKLWPEAHWIELGHRLLAQAWTPVFPHGNDIEQARAQTLSAALPGSTNVPGNDSARKGRGTAGASGRLRPFAKGDGESRNAKAAPPTAAPVSAHAPVRSLVSAPQQHPQADRDERRARHFGHELRVYPMREQGAREHCDRRGHDQRQRRAGEHRQLIGLRIRGVEQCRDLGLVGDLGHEDGDEHGAQ